MFHCVYCAPQQPSTMSLRAQPHCSSCGLRVPLAEPFSAGGRCDACLRWETGQSEIIVDRDLVANLYAAVAERAERDIRDRIYTNDFPALCNGGCDDRPVGECGADYIEGLRSHIYGADGDWLATLSIVATIASSREGAAA